jgi:hypothetical protein
VVCVRYYIAEGVRLYAQDTWQMVVKDKGRDLVAKYIDKVRGEGLTSALGFKDMGFWVEVGGDAQMIRGYRIVENQ